MQRNTKVANVRPENPCGNGTVGGGGRTERRTEDKFGNERTWAELLCGSKSKYDTPGETEVLPTPSVWGLLDWEGEPSGSPRTGRRKAILSLVGTQACQGIC